MTISFNRWDGVSGFALTRMAINGVWGDYHAPVTVTDIGEYWVQFYTIDFAGNIEAEKIAQFVIREDNIETVIIPPVVVNEPPQNDNTPPFETRDDFPIDLHDENVYFQLPPMVIPPFETWDDFPPDLHDEGVYFTYPEDNRVPDGANLPIQTALTGDNVGSHSPDTGIKRDLRPIVDVAELPDNSSAPESIPTATAPIPASNPLNGVLVTLATLGVITASAGALTMTSTALAKKKEQDEAKASQLAHLQAEQALQAEAASANYAENQQKQAQATANVVMAGKQSQANKNFWYAYALWGQKVAQALARRRAEELARKRAEAEALAKTKQKVDMARLAKLVLLGIGLSVIFALFSLIPQDTTSKKDIEYAKPLAPEQSQAGVTACLRPISFWHLMLCVLSLGGSVPVVDITTQQVTNAFIADMLADINYQIMVALAKEQIIATVDEVKQENAEIQSKHIALGRTQIGNNRSLQTFVINLNIILNPIGITVHAFTEAFATTPQEVEHIPTFSIPSWEGANIISNDISNFNNVLHFIDAVERVSVMHFNLGGIENPLEWAKQEGKELRRLDDYIRNELRLYGKSSPLYLQYVYVGEYITATELLFISTHKDICAKTIFYSSSGGIALNPPPQISIEAKTIICGGN